jgi:two-component system, OmpR family, sensor histidine kinase BaeS
MLSRTHSIATAPRTPFREQALWACAALVALLGTLWLYGAQPGVNWPICTLLAVAAFLSFGCAAPRRLGARVAVPLLLACLIASCAAVTADLANELLIAMATLFALGSAIVASYAETSAGGATPTWVAAAPYAAVVTALQAQDELGRASATVFGGRGTPVLRGLAIAVPVTLLLALLLSGADPVFAHWRDAIAQALLDQSILPRSLFFVLIAACMLGACGVALRGDAPGKPQAQPRVARELIGDTERLIVTGAVAALFAVFLLLQVSYLFGNPGGRTGSGVSYADAVHRGFIELNVAATVCGALLFILHRHAAAGARTRWVRALELAVIVQAQILLLSAFQRVDLYEAAYGFTLPRLHVQAYAVGAFIALILLALELRTLPSFDRWLRRVLVVAALIFCALIYANADGWIARQNVARCAQTGQLDVSYLTIGLGADAVPELVNSLARLPAPIASRLALSLDERYGAARVRSDERWFEWSWRRAELRRSMSGITFASAASLREPCRASLLPHSARVP